MAHIGTIAVNGFIPKESILSQRWQNNGASKVITNYDASNYAPPYRVRGVNAGNEVLIINSGSDNTQGDPDRPCYRMGGKGVFQFRWSVINGARSISVRVKQELNQSPRPLLRVKANPSIGVMFDGTAVAASGTGWVTIGTIAVNPTVVGALAVELENRFDGQASICYWDHIVTT